MSERGERGPTGDHGQDGAEGERGKTGRTGRVPVGLWVVIALMGLALAVMFFLLTARP